MPRLYSITHANFTHVSFIIHELLYSFFEIKSSIVDDAGHNVPVES